MNANPPLIEHIKQLEDCYIFVVARMLKLPEKYMGRSFSCIREPNRDRLFELMKDSQGQQSNFMFTTAFLNEVFSDEDNVYEWILKQ